MNIANQDANNDQKPLWEQELRELWFQGCLVKRFRRPAPIAKRILDTFAEQNWAPRIDDPLTPIRGRSQATRLRNAVAALNRRLDRPLYLMRP